MKKEDSNTLGFLSLVLSNIFTCILLNIHVTSYIFQYRFASRSDLVLLFIGVFFTLIKSCMFPFLTIIYGEFSTLLVERAYGMGTSSPTIILKWFGGGKIL